MDRTEKLRKIAEWCRADAQLWHIVTALRGPDSPSERPGDSPSDFKSRYAGRVNRKMKTGAVIRAKAGFTNVGGARYKEADHVTLPKDKSSWDHYDKHINAAAVALGLRVEME